MHSTRHHSHLDHDIVRHKDSLLNIASHSLAWKGYCECLSRDQEKKESLFWECSLKSRVLCDGKMGQRELTNRGILTQRNNSRKRRGRERQTEKIWNNKIKQQKQEQSALLAAIISKPSSVSDRTASLKILPVEIWTTLETISPKFNSKGSGSEVH